MPESPFYVHNLDPFLIQTDWLTLPWYWFFYLLGFFISWLWLRQWIRRGHFTTLSKHQAAKEVMTEKDLADYMVLGWFGLLAGARIVYVLIYHPRYFLENPTHIWQLQLGGMSFHGALLGGGLALLLLSRKKRHHPMLFLDHLVTILPLCLFLGRLGNFINGELAGRPTELPWAVVFPIHYDRLPRHPSQLYQAFFEGLLLFAFLMWRGRKNLPKRGIQSMYFLIGYGVLRFLVEFTRQPDPQLGLYFEALTMGQLLCTLMILVGACGLKIIHSKRYPGSAANLSKKAATHK